MAIIAWASIKAISDSIGVQWDRLKEALGVATEASSIRRAANTNLGRVQTIAATDAQAAADLLQGSIDHQAQVTSGSTASAELLSKDIKNLSNHIKNRGGSSGNTWDLQASAAGERYSPSFAEAARANQESIAAANVFPAVTTLGTYALAGGVGTFTDDDDVDTTLYGAADAEVEVTALIGASDLVLTIDVVDEDGTAAEATCTVPSGSIVGTKVDITVPGSKQITDISDVTHTGGTNGDGIRLQTKLDRTPAE